MNLGRLAATNPFNQDRLTIAALVGRLAVIGQMMAAFSHECRNELLSLKLGLDLLMRMLSKEPEALELISHMRNSEIRLRRLLEDIREYAVPVRLDLADDHISETWRRVWESLRPLRGERDARLDETGDGLDVSTRVDKFRLEQVFRNLFENSLTACSDPVRIELKCSQATLNNHSTIRVNVRDNGPGLSRRQKHRVFEPFFSSKPNGTGLGMAIVKRNIESHGGLITVGNNGVHGAEFTIILPRDCD